MPQKNEISIVIPAEQLVVIQGLVSQLKTAIAPYIHALTPEEVDGMLKMGDKTVAFISKVNDYSVSHPEFVPQNIMNVAEFNKDVNVYNALLPVLKSVREIESNLKDTVILSGSESFAPAITFYNNVKFNADNGVVSAKPIYEDLKQRFPGRKKSKKDQTPPSV